MHYVPLFSDRACAGIELADAIIYQLNQLKAAGISAQPVVYALPRGGIPVALPVARILNCPLNIVVAKKITKPDNPELAIGAVTADGYVLWSELQSFSPKNADLQETALLQAQEKAQAQLAALSPGCFQTNAQEAIAILVDDGIATGMTIAVAAQSLRAQQPELIWICSPVAPMGLIDWLEQWSDRTIILHTPTRFSSVSHFYGKFPQLKTEEALDYLQQHNQQL